MASLTSLVLLFDIVSSKGENKSLNPGSAPKKSAPKKTCSQNKKHLEQSSAAQHSIDRWTWMLLPSDLGKRSKMCDEKAVENTKDESGISIFNDIQRYERYIQFVMRKNNMNDIYK